MLAPPLNVPGSSSTRKNGHALVARPKGSLRHAEQARAAMATRRDDVCAPV